MPHSHELIAAKELGWLTCWRAFLCKAPGCPWHQGCWWGCSRGRSPIETWGLCACNGGHTPVGKRDLLIGCSVHGNATPQYGVSVTCIYLVVVVVCVSIMMQAQGSAWVTLGCVNDNATCKISIKQVHILLCKEQNYGFLLLLPTCYKTNHHKALKYLVNWYC